MPQLMHTECSSCAGLTVSKSPRSDSIEFLIAFTSTLLLFPVLLALGGGVGGGNGRVGGPGGRDNGGGGVEGACGNVGGPGGRDDGGGGIGGA